LYSAKNTPPVHKIVLKYDRLSFYIHPQNWLKRTLYQLAGCICQSFYLQKGELRETSISLRRKNIRKIAPCYIRCIFNPLLPSFFSQKSHQRLPGVLKTKFPFFKSDKQVIFLWHNLTGVLPHCNFPNVLVKLLMRIIYLLLVIPSSCSLAVLSAHHPQLLFFSSHSCSSAYSPVLQQSLLLFNSPSARQQSLLLVITSSCSSAVIPARQHLILLFSSPSCSSAVPPALQQSLLLVSTSSCSSAVIPARQHLLLLFSTSSCSSAVPPALQQSLLLVSTSSCSPAFLFLVNISSCSSASHPALQQSLLLDSISSCSLALQPAL
jgi:hypothetical protein